LTDTADTTENIGAPTNKKIGGIGGIGQFGVPIFSVVSVNSVFQHFVSPTIAYIH